MNKTRNTLIINLLGWTIESATAITAEKEPIIPTPESECRIETVDMGKFTGYIYSKDCESIMDGFRDPGKYRFTPTIEQIIAAEKIAEEQMLEISMKEEGYVVPGIFNMAYRTRQYFGLYNDNGDPIIIIVYVAEEGMSLMPSDNQLIATYEFDDGMPLTGMFQIDVYVNLKTKTLFNISAS